MSENTPLQENINTKVPLAAFATPRALPIEISLPTEDFPKFYIRSTISYEELLLHIQLALSLIIDDKGYISYPVKLAVQELVLCAAFTDIDFHRLHLPTIQMEELYEMYDIIKAAGILTAVYHYVNDEQLEFYRYTLDKTIESILNYRNSIAGIVELLSSQSAELKDQFQSLFTSFEDEAKVGNIIKFAEAAGLTKN